MLGFVFPGQGSQKVGMLSQLVDQHPHIQTTFREASTVLGYDVWDVVTHGPEDKLNQTEIAQPALMAADVALWRVWCDTQEQRPHILAGHSLGEFVALVAAESLSFADGVRLVAARGRFMQQAVPVGQGAMAAIVGLDGAAVAAVCEQAAQGEIVSPANYNSIGQVVIAGQTAAVLRAIEIAKQSGAKLAKQIPVSVPSHCALMAPAATQLAQLLNTIQLVSPKIPVIQNVDAAVHHDVATIRACLVRQLTAPVRWVDTIQSMAAQGITEIVECGPGNVLAGLIKRIDKSIAVMSI